MLGFTFIFLLLLSIRILFSLSEEQKRRKTEQLSQLHKVDLVESTGVRARNCAVQPRGTVPLTVRFAGDFSLTSWKPDAALQLCISTLLTALV